ncbi:hypothetical protein [Aquisphaera insulae]|uniref:hypothetical protein n=1 Tax=Aquisphaera insulae TaxID=2712864 RepID=UPI0013EB4DA0|nr:hypothetical protein [Aquisphaera insulae]
MDARRSRRTRDRARQSWYAYYRQVRFARFLGFPTGDDDPGRAYRAAGLAFAIGAK